MKKIKFNFAKKKIQINLSNKLFYTLVVVGILILSSVVVYAIVPNPGHAVSEVDWSGTISQLNTNSLCLTGDCKSAWPSGGGIDTRCDTPGTCSQVCIGTDCRNNWPSGGGGVDTDCFILKIGEPALNGYSSAKYHGPSKTSNSAGNCECVYLPDCPGEVYAPSDLWYPNNFCHYAEPSCPSCGGFGTKTKPYYLNVDYELHCK